MFRGTVITSLSCNDVTYRRVPTERPPASQHVRDFASLHETFDKLADDYKEIMEGMSRINGLEPSQGEMEDMAAKAEEEHMDIFETTFFHGLKRSVRVSKAEDE